MGDMNQLLDKYKVYFDKIKGENSFYRLGKLFKTKNKSYIYDTGTGKIFCVNENVYKILECLFDTDNIYEVKNLGLSLEEVDLALCEIKSTIEEENILLAPPVTDFTGLQSFDLENQLENNISQLILEVTQRCNLRCKYCIYHDGHNAYRSFSNKDMDFETAKKAIDFTYSKADKEIYISFYGGEPLLKFDLIKKCVEYVKELNVSGSKTVNFAMTTNGVLITKEMATYFNENKFAITISLDGPEEINDENRVFENGTGSFKYALRGIQLLSDAYKDRAKEALFISMVLSENNKRIYERIQSFFNETEFLKYLTVSVSYASQGRVSSDYIKPNHKLDNLILKKTDADPLYKWSIEKQGFEFNKKSLFSNRFMQENLHIVHRRDLSDKPMEKYYFNGCCVPGARRLYVNIDGDFLPCERVGTVPFLGNVEDGFDKEKIKKFYVEEFSKEAVKFCNDCWAVHLCTNCYVDCFDNNDINISYRHKSCNYSRYIINRSLILYHEILENNPESLQPLNDIVLK